MWSRRIGLSFSAIAFGLVAHIVGGSGADWSCVPLVAASGLAALATLGADRLIGYHSRAAGPAIALLGGGQLAMHLALSGALDLHADRFASSGMGLTCGVVVAHAVATGALSVLLLGAQRSMALLAALLDRAARLVRIWFRGPGAVTETGERPVVEVAPGAAVRLLRYGPVRPRRGPPVISVS